MDGQHEGTSSDASHNKLLFSSDASSSLLPKQQQPFLMNQLDVPQLILPQSRGHLQIPPISPNSHIPINGIPAEEEMDDASMEADAFNLMKDDPLLASQGVESISDELSPSKTLEKPYEGMVFDTLEAAGEYYTEYGRQHGFWTRIRSSYKTKPRSDEVTGRVYVCVREGKHEPTVNEETPSNEGKRKRLRSTLKSGCPASLSITLDRYSLKWMVSIFNDDHNHKSVTLCKHMKMKSNKQMPKVVKDLKEAFHRENLRVSKLPSIFGGANIGFDKRYCYNHLRDVRHRELETGDAHAVLNYFRKQ